jgi:hypothetical protein
MLLSDSALATDIPPADRLVFEYGSENANLIPFSIEIGKHSTESTRDVIFVNREVFANTLKIVEDSGMALGHNLPRDDVDNDGFGVTIYSGGTKRASYILSSENSRAIMVLIDNMFQANKEITPAWIVAIESMRL